MSTIVLRTTKGSALTNTEVDNNFSNLNTDKLQLGGTYSSGTANGVTYLNGSKVLTTGSALTFDGTNLGVGTASPFSAVNQTSLTINAPLYPRVDFYSAGVQRAFLNSGSTDTNLYTVGNTPLTFGINNAEAMRLTSTGLGIGTSSPAYKLEVATGTSGQQSLASFRTADSTTANNAGIQIFATPSSTATSRSTYIMWDADGANASGSDYFYIQKLGNSGQVDLIQQSAAAMTFQTTATERMRIDSAGNLGLGVTPSAHSSLIKAFDFNTTGGIGSYSNSTSTQFTYVSSNAFLNSSVNWTYKFTGYAAAAYMQNNGTGVHQWLTAPSGTAGGTIPFTQAMTLTADGNLGVGITSPVSPLTAARGNVTGAGQWASSAIAVYNPTNTGSYSQISFGYTTGTTNASAYMGFVSTNQGTNGYGDLVFGTRAVITDTQPTERVRIDSAGNVGIGTSSPVRTLSIANGGPVVEIDPAGGTAGPIYFNYNRSTAAYLTPEYWALAHIWNANGGTEAMRLDSSGNLGIGTSSLAGMKLVAKGANGYPATSGTTQTGVFRISGGSGVYNVLDMGVNESTDTAWMQATRANSLATYDKLVINPYGGNVGIGTTNIGSRLHVVTTAPSITTMESTAANGGYLTFSNGSTVPLYIGFGSTLTTGLSTSDAALRYSNNLVFSSGSAEKMRIDSSGNVGIGTTSPTSGYMLDVTGKINTQDRYALNGKDTIAREDSNKNIIIGDLTGLANSYINFRTVNSDRVTIDSSGNLLVGTTSTSGSTNNYARIVGGVFSSLKGDLGSLATNSFYTLFDAGAAYSCYLVTVIGITADAANYSATAVVNIQNTSVSISHIDTGGLIFITNSGTAIRVNQNSGGTMGSLHWTALKIA